MVNIGKKVRKKVQKRVQKIKNRSAVLYVFLILLLGICSLFCGCGKENSADPALSEETIILSSGELKAETIVNQSTSTETDEEMKNEEEQQEVLEEEAWDEKISEEAVPLLEQLYTYEKAGVAYDRYLIITGIAPEYQDKFTDYMYNLRYGSIFQDVKYIQFPADVNGIPVKEIGEGAFANMEIDKVILGENIETIGKNAFRNTGIVELRQSDNLKTIGAAAFENCSLESIAFSEKLSYIGKRAFAGNADLWTVLLPKVDAVIEEEAFADCHEDFLLCFGDDVKGKENFVEKYAVENGLNSMEIVLSYTPVVKYPSEPYVLQPQISNFFYGDDGDYEKDQWCTWEYDENAPNFGYSDWQWDGCSTWCGVMDFEQTVRASSELASANGRYCADHVLTQNREAAWAEGAEGNGVGESITYRQSCTTGDNNKWEAISPNDLEPLYDGFMRYTEICIVNGYAKDQKTWEENGRIKRLKMYVEDKLYAYLDLEDTILPQYFSLPEGDIKVLSGGMIEVRFEIAEVYPGSVYEDTCLTGLVMEFSGRHAH